MNRIPNGYLMDKSVVWCEPHGDIYVISKGFKAAFADLSTSDDAHWLNFEHGLRQLACSIGDHDTLQIAFYTGNDFENDLARFDSDTRTCGIPICREVRDELSQYFRGRILAETLIKANVELHVASRFKAKASDFDDTFNVSRRHLEERGRHFDMVLRGIGGLSEELSDVDHCASIMRHWSPCHEVPDVDVTSMSIDELCRRSEASPVRDKQRQAHGFFIDGRYVGHFSVKKFPNSTWQKSMEAVVAMGIPGLRISLNMRKLSSEREEQHEEVRDEKLSKNTGARSIIGREKHHERIRRLQNNQIVPFEAQMIVSVYAKSPEDLDSKMTAVSVALYNEGFWVFNPALPASSIALFNCATPGYGPWTGYKPYWHKIDDLNLAHMWPAGSTPQGNLNKADWLVCGNQNNLCGFNLFVGDQASDAVVIANKGGGKSSTLQYIFLQAARRLGYLAIIDDGYSWMETAHLLDPTCKPIIMQANSGHTYNLFDTDGSALSPQHSRAAVSLSQLLAGKSADEDRNADQGAILSACIKEIYDREFRYWSRKHPDQYYQACRIATLALRTIGEEFADAVQWLKELKSDRPDQFRELDGSLSEGDAMLIEKSRENAHFIRDAGYSMWTPDMFPTLFHLWQELCARKLAKNASPLLGPLATRIEQWLSGGDYGPIVDGVSNIDMGTKYVTATSPLKVVHFEIGELSEGEAELKGVLGYLLAHRMRTTVQSMPRAVKKALVIEEMTSFVRVPNAEKIVIDYSNQMRKYGCWLGYIFQQYSGLLKANKAVAEAILSNALSMILLMNKNPEDLAVLSDYMPSPIPKPICQAIQQFPPPESMRGRKDGYAGMVYVDKSGSRPQYTICHVMMSPKVEEITNSSGDRFDAKRKRLRMELLPK